MGVRPVSPSRKPGSIIAAALAIALFVVFPLLGWLAHVWTDYLWFADLGQSSVFVTRIVSQLAVGAVFATAAFALLFANMRIARRMAPRAQPVSWLENMPEQFATALGRIKDRLSPILDKAILGAALWFAITGGLALSADWQTMRLALQGGSFGVLDPQFGRDVGFWVFSLPAHELITNWLTGILVLATLLALVVHVLDGAIQPWARLKGFAPHVKAHLSVLLALIVLSRAYAYWLDIWKLSFSPRGQVTGASYTDVHAQLPAYRILIVISLLTAAALILNIRFRGWRLPLLALGVWVGAAVLVGGVYPAIIQQFVVSPNEAAYEAPYIERNVKMTRTAFGLSDVAGKPFAASDDLEVSDVRASSHALDNVRLWDPEVVKQSYSQLQSIRSYYDFADVDVDRYTIGGRKRQVLVSARELNTSRLDDKAQNWVNTHLVYTHGFGLVMSPVNEADSRGLPRFIVGDIPPVVAKDLATGTASAELELKQPRIYFGEDTKNYVIVGTSKDEFDYPKGETNAYYTYTAGSGPTVGSLPRRIAWALRLGSSQVLLSRYIKPDSRVLMHRDIVNRIDKLAPWLTLEDDPYPVLLDGRILWVVDAYTHSSYFPHSEGIGGGVNYLRNSVKVTVDAYTGETTFYAFDPEEPILKAWAAIFPTLITSADEIPAGLREHFRYPQGLFSAQAEVYRTYHMTNVNVFYNKEDLWQLPGERQGEPMEPFFVLLRLPGEAQEHFYMMQPYTPRNRDNMIGWMAASCDPENYGQRTVYQFPKDRVILGPEQVTARINQDPVISPQLTLWNQRGSGVLFGNMLVIPIKDSVVYVQPLFLQAEKTAIPELTRVIVAYADKVVMERDIESALLSIFGEQAPAAPDGSGESAQPGESGEPAGEGEQLPNEDARATAQQAQELYERAVAAQKKGDWAAYGRLLDELGTVLEELAQRK